MTSRRSVSSATDLTSCVGPDGNCLLPVDPYRSLRVHFGMLLGVDDFATVGAYHRGKMWLHDAWLHGPGPVWGLAVSRDVENGEVRVAPGLAIDALGRELHLEADVCVSVARWFEQHREDPDLNVELLEGGGVRFDAHVVMQAKACLTRQVPALSEACEGSGAATAYSRVLETVELLLVPGPAPPSPPLPYHRLRLLFQLEDPIAKDGSVIAADQAVLDRREQILGAPGDDQPALYLEALREFAALDEMEIGPASTADGDERSLFPSVDPAPLVLAELHGLSLSAAEGGSLTDGHVDNTVRGTLVPTSTIQELLCGLRVGGAGDAGGPRVDATSVTIEGAAIRFRIARDLPQPASIANSLSVSLFDEAAGWSNAVVQNVAFESADQIVTVHLQDAPPAGVLARLIVRGTGPSPLLGMNRVPLAGALGGPPGSRHQGQDFVHMLST